MYKCMNMYIVWADKCNYIFLQKIYKKLKRLLGTEVVAQKRKVSFSSHNLLYSVHTIIFIFVFKKQPFFKKIKYTEVIQFSWFKIKNHPSVNKMCLQRPRQLQLSARREFCQAYHISKLLDLLLQRPNFIFISQMSSVNPNSN